VEVPGIRAGEEAVAPQAEDRERELPDRKRDKGKGIIAMGPLSDRSLSGPGPSERVYILRV
jgi:hypothetical protein